MSTTDLNECLKETKDLFEKLSAWKEESHQQISHIMKSHNNNITNGIHDLVEQVDDLKAKLSEIKTERKVLMETVNNLNCDIRQLNAKLQHLQEVPEKQPNNVILDTRNNDEDLSKTHQQNEESSVLQSKGYESDQSFLRNCVGFKFIEYRTNPTHFSGFPNLNIRILSTANN